MSRPPNQNDRLLFPIHLAGRVALVVSLTALLILAATLFFISDEVGKSYLQVLQSYQYTQSALGPALVIAGLAMLAVGGLITWLVALYGSFRIAGPLYRFRRNLEQIIEHGPVEPVPIRRSDSLHADAEALTRATAQLRNHYTELSKSARQAEQTDASDRAESDWLDAVERLRDLDSRARF